MKLYDDGYGSFGGLVCNDISIEEADVLIIGIPYDGAASGRKGASFGPLYLRLISKDMQTMSRNGIDFNNLVIKDLGNVQVFPLHADETRKSIENAFTYFFSLTSKPILTLGGDHSSTFPILKALAKQGNSAIIWFDAHRDLSNELIGSQYSHGSPLRRAIELENINPENILLVGTRYMEQEEQMFLEEYGLRELRMVDLESSKFDLNLFISLVNEITTNVDSVYVSIDIDVLDPAAAPGTGTPVGGGMTTSQLMRYLGAIPVPVRAFDIMEVSPPMDISDITLKATMGLVTEILAHASATYQWPKSRK